MPSVPHITLARTYGERSDQPNLPPLSAYLLRLCHYKRTNLCVSADVTTTRELLRIAEEVGEHICVLKTHADIVSDFGDRTMSRLREIARRKLFLIFEDRKFGDIGNTVQQQYSGGPLTIVRWAQIVNANIFPGPAIITALAQAAQQAITLYNTSVHTDIRASPTASRVGSVADTINGNGDDDDDSDDGNYDSASDRYGSEREEEDGEEEVYPARKQSVVSVSTTISMKSEPLSPCSRPSQSRGHFCNADDDEWPDDLNPDPANVTTALEHLGPPPYCRGLLLLAQMSSAGNFFTPEYTAACARQAREHRDFVMGFIAQRSLNEEPDDNFVTMTPGVQLAAGGDAMGQQYNTPAHVIGDAGCDIIIVGRGILAASDRAAAAAEYRAQGWSAYESRVRTARKCRSEARMREKGFHR